MGGSSRHLRHGTKKDVNNSPIDILHPSIDGTVVPSMDGEGVIDRRIINVFPLITKLVTNMVYEGCVCVRAHTHLYNYHISNKFCN